jgi:hypothetical protein
MMKGGGSTTEPQSRREAHRKEVDGKTGEKSAEEPMNAVRDDGEEKPRCEKEGPEP